jgi:para-nitrobenzyl esterase
LIREDERPAFKAGRLHEMPLIVGTNVDEGTLLTRGWPVATVADHHTLMAANFPHDLARALALYPAADDTQARPAVAEAFADTQFNCGARLLLRAMLRQGPRCWRYLFARRRPGQVDGPHHGDEVGHVFGNLAAGRGAEPLPFDAVDAAVSSAMMQAWAAFARQGDPNAPGLPHWPGCDEHGDPQLVFGDHVAIGADTRRERLDFLDRYLANA